MASESKEQGHTFLPPTEPAIGGPGRLTLAIVLGSTAVFAATASSAKAQLTPVFAFIPAYDSALVVNDPITEVLLFGQLGFLRSRGLALLASGYLFTASSPSRSRHERRPGAGTGAGCSAVVAMPVDPDKLNAVVAPATQPGAQP